MKHSKGTRYQDRAEALNPRARAHEVRLRAHTVRAASARAWCRACVRGGLSEDLLGSIQEVFARRHDANCERGELNPHRAPLYDCIRGERRRRLSEWATLMRLQSALRLRQDCECRLYSATAETFDARNQFSSVALKVTSQLVKLSKRKCFHAQYIMYKIMMAPSMSSSFLGIALGTFPCPPAGNRYAPAACTAPPRPLYEGLPRPCSLAR